jgi:hypothetical protein
MFECEQSVASMTSRENDSTTVTMTLSPLRIHDDELEATFEYTAMAGCLGSFGGLPLNALPECDSLTSMTSDLSFSNFSMLESPRI